MIKDRIQSWVQTRPFKTGETIEFGWFIFRIANEENPPELETLDFKAMASFTNNFHEVEQINFKQQQALVMHGVKEEPCVLWHSALISKSFSPTRPDGFIERTDPLKGKASGWYIGVENEERDMNDVNSFVLKSLYEISLQDKRMLPYWLYPVGTKVRLATADVTIKPTYADPISIPTINTSAPPTMT